MAAAAIVRKYNSLRNVIGHDDIAPGGKEDPGPAFAMSSFRSAVMGREEDAPREVLKTTEELNIRLGPGTQHNVLPASPLPEGTPVVVLETSRNWRFVEVLDTVNGLNDLEGWVHGAFLSIADD